MISLDTETTGRDFFHGARPYYVTTCDENGVLRSWQWSVNPISREPLVCKDDIAEMQSIIDSADAIAIHGAKFDVQALSMVGVDVPWSKVRCTLMGSHLLATNHPHNLADTCAEYLGGDIGVRMERLEKRVEEVTKACRGMVRRNAWADFGVDTSAWRLAEKGDPDMPSVGGSDRDEEKPWKADMWIVHEVAQALLDAGVDLEQAGFDPSWLVAMPDYANCDSAVTLPLWLWMEGEIGRRHHRKIFDERMRLVPVACGMELDGVTTIGADTEAMIAEYSAAVDLAQAECLAVADTYDFPLELPDGAAPNDSIREFVWGSVRLECPRCGTQTVHKHWVNGEINGQATCKKCLSRKGRKTKRGLVGGPVTQECVVIENPCLALPKIYSGKTGNPTLDAAAMEQYVTTLDDGPALDFVAQLLGMRSRQTAVSYMRSYKRFGRPTNHGGYDRLHPSYNPTGTDHLRWSSANPNAQNISKKEDFNLRKCFGPMPGREWWSMDFRNIESRIPAYESGEPKMIEVVENLGAPYWANLYYLTASVLYPQEYWQNCDTADMFKKKHPRLYKRSKFFVLAKQYGCGRHKGDLLSGITGSFDLVDQEFPLMAKLQQHYLDFARRHGYVETIPDREVDPDRGYPILAARGEDGQVSTTTPFNYHISGTAMQCTNRAMVKTDARVREWNAEGWDGFLTLQVHDELVWDCPRVDGDEPWRTNLWRMDVLKGLMEEVGAGIGMPTPTSREYHSASYAVGLAV